MSSLSEVGDAAAKKSLRTLPGYGVHSKLGELVEWTVPEFRGIIDYNDT